METQERQNLADKQRIVIKIGSSSLTHAQTGEVNLMKIEKLVRVISDLRGQGKDVVLVSSGAIAAGRQALEEVNVWTRQGLTASTNCTTSPRQWG